MSVTPLTVDRMVEPVLELYECSMRMVRRYIGTHLEPDHFSLVSVQCGVLPTISNTDIPRPIHPASQRVVC